MSAAADGPERELAATIVGALAAAGTDTMFGVPGGGANLELVGAAEEAGLRFVLAHGETSSCIMAGTYGVLRDQPGVATMTRGPGAASSVNGALQATLDRAPLVLVTDTVTADQAAWVPHQRVDQRALFAPATKLSATIGADGDALARAAVAVALAQPAGAVHLDFDPGVRSDAPPPVPMLAAAADPAAIERAQQLLASAHRPVVLAGTEAWPWVAEVRGFVEATGCPVMTTYQARGMVSDRSPHAAGVFTNGTIERPLIDSADLILAVGLDPVELIPKPWTYTAPVVSLLPWHMDEPYYLPTVELVGPVGASLAELRPAVVADGWDADEAARFRRDALTSLRVPSGDRFDPADVIEAIDDWAPDDATVTVDAGAHMLVAVPMVTVTEPHGLLISNGLATMGYSIPAAIAASLARPGRRTVAFTGDGGLGMILSELETIVRLDLDLTVVVFNDAALSLIEIKQGERHGGQPAVRYRGTDFATVAEGMGLPATVVTTRADLERVLAAHERGPVLIDARVDPSSYRHVITVTRG
ncbi:MAG: thiamine pyrophosphate-binding protein [Actinobacteria bacterium]|nr:thiamine pyrophosphate-binding protein [Actinomycetota bacterium]